MADLALQAAAAGASPSQADRFQLVLHTTADTLAQPDDTTDDVTGDAIMVGNSRLHPSTARRLTCDCPTSTATSSPDGELLHLGRRTRRIRNRLRRAVNLRDDGRCQVPGCTEAATVIHHLRHWANGGTTCLPNLVSLCDGHHWQVHEGGFTLAVRKPGQYVLLAPSGLAVGPHPDLPSMVDPLPHDEDIEPDAVTGGWTGERLSLAYAADLLAQDIRLAKKRASAETPAAA
jgi:hypothetical protein